MFTVLILTPSPSPSAQSFSPATTFPRTPSAALVADIFDNAASLTDTHAKYAEVSTEFGASVTSVPYHPGAAKYFAEKGFDVPTK
ncbi:MAG: TAXI family TRAP transporter solute-binding subunit [Acutalibacteraceae bacterium]